MKQPNITFDEMISRADAAVETLTPEEANALHQTGQALIVDIRDVRELQRDGCIAGAEHVPRGMLEFWIHPQSPYFRDYFDTHKKVVLMCNKGWRSALAAKALGDLGFEVAHMQGGYGGWQDSGLETQQYARKV